MAVVDTDKRAGRYSVRGFIPTGWYPTAVALDGAGRQLFIASGYGFGSIAPTPATRAGRSYQDRVGVVSMLAVPGADDLAKFTKQVLRFNNGKLPPGGAGGRDRADHPVPMHVGQPSPIKHVFYIIKENHTYDQVFGALPQGKGDPSLVHFGRDGLQREMAEFSMTIDFSEPDSGPADILNRAIWHSVKGWDTPYNYGRPVVQRHASFESLLRLTGTY